MNLSIILAILRRNLGAYFSSPIGYVFICAFVLLCAIAAFWPNEFFNRNLCNLDQLNQALPWIMLVIVPAISMTIWSDERRQGTDELLLTQPASDLDVVAGKYLASLAIFTIALVFSLCNVGMLRLLGSPDPGLIASDYIGYWMVGAAMLAVGMVASFLSSNLTVSFILAAAFNAPLAFASSADAILPRTPAAVVRSVSIAEQFRDFGRGVITLHSIVFFASIAAITLYLCMVLISRRHWGGRSQRFPMALHYTVRVLALMGIAIGANAVAARYNIRTDISSERLSSLGSETKVLLGNLSTERPVIIDAYVSSEVPEEYVQTRLNLLTVLREVDSIAGDAVTVRITPTEPYSSEAAEAQDQFGIRAQPVQTLQRGAFIVRDIFLGAAFMCGTEKVVVPFFDRGIPAEYEVIRSIVTASDQKRKRIGVVTTDAKLFGGFDMASFSQREDQPIVSELRKQYEVTQVDPNQPIATDFDALLVAQPSSLPQGAMDHLVAAVGAGVPTAIFEDPFPYFDPAITASSQPRRPGGNPFMQREMPEPKGDVTALWDLLGVRYSATTVVRQDYNPYPKLGELPPEFVFIDRTLGRDEGFSLASSTTNTLQQVLFVFPGSFEPAANSESTFSPLISTGTRTSTVQYDDMLIRDMLMGASLNPNRRSVESGQPFVIAAEVSAPAQPSDSPAKENAPGAASSPEAEHSRPIRAVVVSDVDALFSVFFAIRQRSGDPEAPIDLQLDNVTFVLNVLDSLAGDDRFVEIRGRRPKHRTLTELDRRTENSRAVAAAERKRFIDEFDARQAEEQGKLDQRIAELQAREGIDPRQMRIEIASAKQVGENRLSATVDRLKRERDTALNTIETNLAVEITRVQFVYKLLAVALPPIPPLVLAVLVYLRRRKMENVGVSDRRLGAGA